VPGGVRPDAIEPLEISRGGTMTTPAQVLAYLDTLGGVRLDEFDQGVRQGEARITKGQVDEGFCRGVCTDWLRRVIQGGNPWYDPAIRRVDQQAKPKKTPEQVAAHKEEQTLRMATIQLRSGGNAVPATTFQERLGKAQDELLALYNSNLEATELAIPADLLRRVHEFQTFDDQAKYSMTFIGQLLDALGEQVKPDADRSWPSFAAGMDKYFAGQRGAQTRHAPKKLFSGIAAGLTQVSYENYHGLDAAADALLDADEFVPGTGVIAGFRINVPKGGKMESSGHAVAAFRHNNDLFEFFDPNYAIYRFNRAAVIKAIEYLFGTIYQENGWRVLTDTGFCAMRLSVFRRAN
jgi:hypothetical protein